MMPALFLFLLLGAFWALLSGQFHNNFLIAAGVLCITFIVWMSRRMGLLDDEGVPARFYPRALVYLPWLAWQIILSNWDVFKRIWSKEMPIDPSMRWIPYGTRHPFVTATYANSITLTPGTVTVLVEQDRMLIHCLAKDIEEGLASGDMEQHCKRLES